MARSKVKLAFIENASARRVAYRKRMKGLKKLVSELSILCDVNSCAIIYGPYSPEPEVWPSHVGVQEVLTRFKGLSGYHQTVKMVNQDSLMSEYIKKAEEKLMKLQRENRCKEATQVMFRFLMDEQSSNLNALDLLGMGPVALETVMDISQGINELMQKNCHTGNPTQGMEMVKDCSRAELSDRSYEVGSPPEC